MERNLHEDLEICNTATEGAWNADRVEWPGNENLRHWVMTHEDGLACAVSYEDARFIAEARDGWPHAIERALSAEADVERLRKIIDRIYAYVQEKWEEEPEREAQIAYCRVLFEIERSEREEVSLDDKA
ncbi:hypothetical protein EEL30_15550 [Brevibacillus laterosporus]|uniref:Uncharacterized protein n=1 Tax=Brevibacillus laterosporus TaxID=1465 RepID=A0A518V9A9_BRELA|nr:hypothetical protein EEL30_15550 [Brevibacillus laterosporus]